MHKIDCETKNHLCRKNSIYRLLGTFQANGEPQEVSFSLEKMLVFTKLNSIRPMVVQKPFVQHVRPCMHQLS